MPVNAIGRSVPAHVNGYEYEPYMGPFETLQAGPRWSPLTRVSQNRGRSKVVPTLEELVDAWVPNGGWVSMPHWYRNEATGLGHVLRALRATGKKGVHLISAAFFPAHAELLLEALRDGTIGGIEANAYGPLAAAVARGELNEIVVGRSHGGRARAMQQGERVVDLAVGFVATADRWGNSNGVQGPNHARFGAAGLFEPDLRWSRHSVLLCEQVHPGLIAFSPLDMRLVDAVVQVDKVGDRAGVTTGTTDLARMRKDKQRVAMASHILEVLEASQVVRDGFSFQVGSGAGLLVLEDMVHQMHTRGIKAGWTVGGVTEWHIDLLEAGLLEVLLNGQTFTPTDRVCESLLHDCRHKDVSTAWYYSPASKQEACCVMDVAVLGASEVGVDFSLNTVTGYDGKLRTGIGGAQDAAAGAHLTVAALPLARVNRKGLSAPCVRERVHTVVTPGDCVDVVVTEEHVAVNPRSTSPWVPPLLERAAAVGLELTTIEALVDASMQRAKQIGTLMEEPRHTDEIVYAVEWRDGRLLDVVRKLES